MYDKMYLALGFDLVLALKHAHPEAKVDADFDSDSDCVVSVHIKDVGAVHLQKWGKKNEYYIKVHAGKKVSPSRAGVLHLNLDSFEVRLSESAYIWHLPRPTNKISRSAIEEVWGLDHKYFETWKELSEFFVDAIFKVLSAHLPEGIDGAVLKEFNSNAKVAHKQYMDELARHEFIEMAFERYDHKCAITGDGPDLVLEAVQILTDLPDDDAYSPSNALLLRSDLQRLFEDGALRINPRTRKVEIDNCLRGTSYSYLEGKKIRKGEILLPGWFYKLDPYPSFDILDEKYSDALEEYMYEEDDEDSFCPDSDNSSGTNIITFEDEDFDDDEFEDEELECAVDEDNVA